MRATQHSGRMGSARHNDRQFDLDGVSHIDKSRQDLNLYSSIDDLTFAESEEIAYNLLFADMIDDINARAIKSRHPERCTNAKKLLASPKTMPEEVILQVGDKDNHIHHDLLMAVYEDYSDWHSAKFGNNVFVLDYAMHADEATPHIHERRVWTYDDPKGITAIGQHKALEQLGYTLPDPSKPRSRTNNLKQVYSAECRDKWLEICNEHGLDIDQEPKHLAPTEQNLRKNDYIIAKQTDQLRQQEQRLQHNNQVNQTLIEQMDHLQHQLGVRQQQVDKLDKNKQELIERINDLNGKVMSLEQVDALKPKKALFGTKIELDRQDYLDLQATARKINDIQQQQAQNQKDYLALRQAQREIIEQKEELTRQQVMAISNPIGQRNDRNNIALQNKLSEQSRELDIYRSIIADYPDIQRIVEDRLDDLMTR